VENSTDSYGPKLYVDSWIDRANSGNPLTGSGATGDIAHFEITSDVESEKQWIRSYMLGRQALIDTHYPAAIEEFQSGDFTGAIIDGRLVSDIPNRGWHYARESEIVAAALDYQLDWQHYSPDFDRICGTAMNEVFGPPFEAETEISEVISKSRLAIKGNEVESWQSAVERFERSGKHHQAGIAALELGTVYEISEKPDEALSKYERARNLLHNSFKEIMFSNRSDSETANLDTSFKHLKMALTSIIEVCSYKPLNQDDLEVLKSAVYELDDLTARWGNGGNMGVPAKETQTGYEILARSSSRFWDRWFFMRESREVAMGLEIWEKFRRGIGSSGHDLSRRDRRSKRPKATLYS